MHVAKMQRARPPSRYRGTRVFIYVRSIRGRDVHRCDINENMSLSIPLAEKSHDPVPRLKESDIRAIDHSNLPSFVINGNLLLARVR